MNLELLLHALGKRYGAKLSLQNGICALNNAQGQEAVVIEVPADAAMVMLHCTMTALASSEVYRHLLKVNFQMDKTLGCWLALDDLENVQLCDQLPLVVLDELTFCDWVSGFITHAMAMRTRLSDVGKGSQLL
ncbi:type III secretion system chaperone [Pseudomonas sp. 15FMM2]|uniref:Type III secretion system chaperone n=1 Tax=Pseudomonas imrae TaxID=2992837 RepID=A0ACC7PQK7_9PSED